MSEVAAPKRRRRGRKNRSKFATAAGSSRFQEQARNSRQKVAGLQFARVGKVERRVRGRLRPGVNIQAGLTTAIAAVTETVMLDLFRRSVNLVPDGKRSVTAGHVARALVEPGCLVHRLTGARHVAGIYVAPPLPPAREAKEAK